MIPCYPEMTYEPAPEPTPAEELEWAMAAVLRIVERDRPKNIQDLIDRMVGGGYDDDLARRATLYQLDRQRIAIAPGRIVSWKDAE